MLCSLLQMANMEAETTERNKQNDRFASLTDSDLDKLLIEKMLPAHRELLMYSESFPPVLKGERTARKL